MVKYQNTIKEVQEMVDVIERITNVINADELLSCEKVDVIKAILGLQEEEEKESDINYAVFPVQDVDIVNGFYENFNTFDEIDDILSLLLNTEFDIEEK